MRALLLLLALSVYGVPVFSHDHEKSAVVASECNCPPDCHCKKPGGTCEGGVCVEGCQCDKKPWVHEDILAVIEKEKRMGSLTEPPAPTEFIDGVEQFTGFVPSAEMYEGAPFKEFPIWEGRASIPEELDYTKVAPPKIVRQQCGDCWAQGAAMAFEGVIGWLDRASRDISRQSIIDCSGKGSCNGGYISVEFFKDPKGAVYTADYPYLGRNQRCQSDRLVRKEKARGFGFVRGNGNSRFKVSSLQQALVQYGPLEVCGAASALGGSDSDGFIMRNKSGRTNHCWALYGWKPGEKYGKPAGIYGIMVNSHGTSFGKNGIVFVRLAQDDENLDGSVITEAAYIDYKDPRPPEPMPYAFETDMAFVSGILDVTANYSVVDLESALKESLRVKK